MCDSDRSFVVYEAIKRGVSFETIYNITKIDPWFLAKLQGLAETELALAGLRGGILTEELYRTAKNAGASGQDRAASDGTGCAAL